MITKLTKAQLAKLPEYRDKWLKIGLATGPCDRGRCENAVDLAYQKAGLEKPTLKIWLRSPLEGAVGAAVLARTTKDCGDQVRDQVWDQVGDQVRDQIWDQVRDQVWAQVGDQIWDQIWAQVRDQVRDQIWDQIWDQVGAQAGDQVRDQVWDQVYSAGYGSHDASWLSFYDFFEKEAGIESCNKLEGLFELSACGWWWPFVGAVILTERPVKILRDERHRLHSQTGAALLYPDGFSIYAWHGTRVPSEWIESTDSVDASLALTWENIEQRRALCEVLGWDRVISRLDTRSINKHDDPSIGELIEVDLPDAPATRFLKVRCATGRDFVLGVPPEVSTAVQAQCAINQIDETTFASLQAQT